MRGCDAKDEETGLRLVFLADPSGDRVHPGSEKLPDDPWKHRSTGMRCSTCMFYVEKTPANPINEKKVGRCRRHAPVMQGYPVVFPADWCGDHKLDETKL